MCGPASPRHLHCARTEPPLASDGSGRLRLGGGLLTLVPRPSVMVEPDAVWQVDNDGDEDVLWLVIRPRPCLH